MKLYHRLSAEDNMLTNHILNLFSDSEVRLISQSTHLADCRASKEKTAELWFNHELFWRGYLEWKK